MRLARALVFGTLLATLAAPAPVRAQDKCGVGPFIVFFDFESARLVPEAQQILDSAAAGFSANCVNSHVLIGGATDGAERPGLSEDRAEAVRAYMFAHGVRGSALRTEARGFTKPLVRTPIGVKEPQNRYVELSAEP